MAARQVPSMSGGKKKDSEYYAKARKHAEGERHKQVRDGVTNTDYAKQSGQFAKCCEAAGVKPTARQASKFRNGHGAAYAAGKAGAV